MFLHPEDYRDSKIVLEGEWVSDNRSSERPALLMDSEGHSVEVFCKDKYTSRVSSGDRVRVYGVMKTEGDPEDLMAADGWIECRQTLELLERR